MTTFMLKANHTWAFLEKSQLYKYNNPFSTMVTRPAQTSDPVRGNLTMDPSPNGNTTTPLATTVAPGGENGNQGVQRENSSSSAEDEGYTIVKGKDLTSDILFVDVFPSNTSEAYNLSITYNVILNVEKVRCLFRSF